MTKLKGIKHTRYFSTTDEVEYVFDLTLNFEQRIMVQAYLTLGERPDPKGCWTCSPAAMRILTSHIDHYEDMLDSGAKLWPWSGDGTELAS